MYDYQNVDVCSNLVTEKTGLNPSDLKTRLELTSGVDPDGAQHYRPYYMAAKLLRERRDVLVTLPGGVKVDTQTAANEYMATQGSLDGLLSLTVPPNAVATVVTTTKPTTTPMSGSIPVKRV